MSQQKPPTNDRGQIEQHAKKMYCIGERVIAVQPVPVGQEDRPVVLASAHQRQRLRPRVSHRATAKAAGTRS